MKKKNPNKPHRPRSPLAVHVARRNVKSSPMKHRLEPKKGAKNDQPELLDEVDQGDRQDCICHMHPNDGVALAHGHDGKQVVPGCPTHDPNGLDIEEDQEEHECDL